MASPLSSEAAAPRLRAWVPPAVGAIVLAVALLAITSWLLREPQLLPVAGYRMVFNTALCFALAAIALFFNASRLRAGIQTAIGAIIMLLAGLVLAQFITGYALGIDLAWLHDWIDDFNPHPGRMAPATGIAFLLTGAGFIALHRARGRAAPYLARGLAAAVMAIGLSALIGLLLKLDVMFDVYLFAAVALPTAVCFVLTAAGMWTCVPWLASARITGADRIVYAGAAVLVTFGLVLGLAGLVALRNYGEKTTGDAMLRAAQDHATLFVTIIDEAIGDVMSVTGRPNIIRFHQQLRQRPLDAASQTILQQAAENEVVRGFSAFEFRDAGGTPIASAGQPRAADSEPLFSLRRPQPARVYWDQGFVLHVEAPIQEAARIIGTVVAQRPLVAITAHAFNEAGLGRTGELSICAADKRLLYCAPQRLRRAAYNVPRDAGDTSLAMIRAVQGHSGTVVTTDYRRRRALFAYTPVGDLGLALALKKDTAELYEPLRRQLGLIALLMLAMLLAGVSTLRLAVRPLASSLHESELRLSLALRASRRALWDWDLRSGRVFLSEQWQAMLGGASVPTETTLADLRARVHPEDGPRLDQHLREVLRGTTPLYDMDHRVRRSDGSWLWIRSRGEVIERDASGRALRLTGTNSDITTRVQVQEKLAHQATHDQLTGLPNRALYDDRLAQAIARSRRSGVLMAVMYLDIDRFKQINDSLGHEAGDALLVEFSRRLVACVRATDTVARLGGDEFAMILESLSSRANGERIAEKIVAAMQSEFALGHRRLFITTSVGIAFHDGEVGIGQGQLVKRADEALYCAKAAGRNTYQVFDSSDKGGRMEAEGKTPQP